MIIFFFFNFIHSYGYFCSAFHQKTLDLAPTSLDKFEPCFFVYPKNTKMEASKLQWPASVEELDSPSAWPMRAIPPNRPTSQLEPTNPLLETVEMNPDLMSKAFDVHRFRYEKNAFVTHTEWASSPVLMHVNLRTTAEQLLLQAAQSRTALRLLRELKLHSIRDIKRS